MSDSNHVHSEGVKSPSRHVTTDKTIQTMVRRIVDRFDPEQIILFGSHARGTAGPDSDVDLLVVMKGADTNWRRVLAIRLALHDIRAAKDIVVTTPEAFARRKEIPGTIEHPAAQEGRVLYARG